MFSLHDNSGILDAATVGDPTRCLNDSVDKDELNVQAEREFPWPPSVCSRHADRELGRSQLRRWTVTRGYSSGLVSVLSGRV